MRLLEDDPHLGKRGEFFLLPPCGGKERLPITLQVWEMQEMQVVLLHPLCHTFPLMEVGGGGRAEVMGFLNLLGILAAETVLSFLGPLCISLALLFLLRQVPQRDLAPVCTFGWVCTSNAGQCLLGYGTVWLYQ